GAPAPLVFSGTTGRAEIHGTVRQGSAHGTFKVRRGSAPGLIAPGFYAGAGHDLAVVDDPYGPARLLDLATGEVHGLYQSGAGFVVGSGFATRAPAAGTARFDATTSLVDGAALKRSSGRQLEVRFKSGSATLSGTLTLPPGSGPFAAVAWVHGSGRTTRAYLPDLQALLVHDGVAVLAYDKRGVGQSGGSYPGEAA